ncbi:ABC transporter substrate-binding protein [Pleionea sediminis]|uniref:ABC transporter substrate-binding protein n=1 Tax=Pleionea sediminis TaxID=2569479 RepID=UPI001184F94F|nr:ABC transporter substrate-binding protein [Pleionea sediminis]
MKNFLICIVSALSISGFAQNYVDNKPMKDVVSGKVGQVYTGQVTEVPIISWGGDIATIHANGDAVMTKKGSIFNQLGLNIRLIRQDVFSKQVEDYMAGKTPYLRGTVGMITQAADVLNSNEKTKPVVIYQMTWSNGGDAFVVKDNIKSASDLKGKTIAIQAYGPHTDYLIRILKDSGLSLKDVNIKWTRDLTGTDQTPMEAFYESNVDAAFVIIPDALALTSGGNIGTGSEASVKGAKILMSTKTANRVIADIYAVRSDYLKTNRADVEKFVRGLMLGQEALEKLVANKTKKSQDYRKMIKGAALALLDSEAAVADAEGMYIDAEFVGFDGNVKFLNNAQYPRNLNRLNTEAKTGLSQLGLASKGASVKGIDWDFGFLKAGLSNIGKAESPKFDSDKVAEVVTRKQQQGSLEDGELFSFEVFFQPNQSNFSASLYEDSFKRVIDLASTYGGAVITVEGHSDPMGYLRKKKANVPQVVLGQTKQSARNLSLSRAQAVRDSIIEFAKKDGLSLDPSQFATIGHGIAMPNTGVCGTDPCAPKNESEWRSNMRVVFRIIQVEAEADVFAPL